MLDVLVDAYYRRIVGLPVEARARAQQAYTLSVGVALALVAAGLIGDVSSLPTAVQVLGVADVLLWIVASGFYLYAVAADVPAPPTTKSEGDDNLGLLISEWPQHVIEASEHERSTIDGRQRKANLVAAGAAAVALVAAGLAIWMPRPTASEARVGRVYLTADGRAAATAICGRSIESLYGGVQKQPRGLEIRVTNCGDQPKVLALTDAQVLAVAYRSSSGS